MTWIKGNRVFNETAIDGFRKWDSVEKAYYRIARENERPQIKKDLLNAIIENPSTLLFMRYAKLYGKKEARDLREALSLVEEIGELKEEIETLEARSYKKVSIKKKKLDALNQEFEELKQDLAKIDKAQFSDIVCDHFILE